MSALLLAFQLSIRLTGHRRRRIDNSRGDDIQHVARISLGRVASLVEDTTDGSQVHVTRQEAYASPGLDCDFSALEQEPVSFCLVRLCSPVILEKRVSPVRRAWNEVTIYVQVVKQFSILVEAIDEAREAGDTTLA